MSTRFPAGVCLLAVLTTSVLLFALVQSSAVAITTTTTTTTTAAAAESKNWHRPAAYNISGVPYHRQITDFTCGDACAEMLLNHFGSDVNQGAIGDVARTSSANGTFTLDLVRAFQFSQQSSAQGDAFPAVVPRAGYSADRPLGYGAFRYADDACWLDELEAVLADGVPVALLMAYAEDDMDDGHFRLAIGYDADRGVLMLDPWDRDGNPTEAYFAPDRLCRLWSYRERVPLTDEPLRPYAAVAAAPWDVRLDLQPAAAADAVVLRATVGYRAPGPFARAAPRAFVARQAQAAVAVPAGWTVQGPAVLPLGDDGVLPGGAASSAQWTLVRGGGAAAGGGAACVTAGGLVAGALPAVPSEGAVPYPAYTYEDRIGGGACVALPASR